MFRSILVAIDGSAIGRRALEEALSVARAMGAPIHAVHVVQTGSYPSLTQNELEPPAIAQQALLDALDREADEILADAEELAAAAGVPLTAHKRWGQHPGAEILGLAQELGADLTVVGSHGKGRLGRFFLGSTSSYVVDHTTSTVMVVRGEPDAS
jgi:nucleotide-binding universal stress UspA family protein